MPSRGAPDAVIVDLDGVLIDTDWGTVRATVTRENGGRWHDGAEADMAGLSSPEWSRYLHDRLGVQLAPAEINELVVAGMRAQLEATAPLLPDARETVRALAETFVLGLASSANRELLDAFLDGRGLRECFAVVVSSEEVARGKPAPDVYLDAARRLGAPPRRCVAVEDSTNGLRSALAAGMCAIAVLTGREPPGPEVLARAAASVASLRELTPSAVTRVFAAWSPRPPLLVVIGVEGVGKTTVARRVAAALGVELLDADDFHTAADVAAMHRGEPLDDTRRRPWLDRLHDALGAHRDTGAVLACSALRASYRARLAEGLDQLRFVALVAPPEVLRERLVERPEHFAGPALLDSQLATLELTGDAVVVDADRPLDAVVRDVVAVAYGDRAAIV